MRGILIDFLFCFSLLYGGVLHLLKACRREGMVSVFSKKILEKKEEKMEERSRSVRSTYVLTSGVSYSSTRYQVYNYCTYGTSTHTLHTTTSTTHPDRDPSKRAWLADWCTKPLRSTSTIKEIHRCSEWQDTSYVHVRTAAAGINY